MIFGWDCGDVLYDRGPAAAAGGSYPDNPARLDLSTFRRIPWEPGAAFVLADFYKNDTTALPISLAAGRPARRLRPRRRKWAIP